MSDPLGLINTSSPMRPAAPSSPVAGGDVAGPDFKDVLMKQIGEVNRMQQDAELAIEDLVSGRREDIDAVLIAKQKSDIAFQMLLQVRNKMMDAYDEIKQIRV